MADDARAHALGALSSLTDPNRRRLYEVVVARGGPVNRDEAAAAAGIDRSLAAYHLDKLVEEGLLAASFARPPGRGGRGAGRPAKRYERSAAEVAVSVPPRDYRLAAELLARAVETDVSGAVRDALLGAAEAVGSELATSAVASPGADPVIAQLEAQGYEPFEDGDVIRLRNCPFHQIAREHTEVVCGMNLALMEGFARASGGGLTPRLDPGPDRCCVAFARDEATTPAKRRRRSRTNAA